MSRLTRRAAAALVLAGIAMAGPVAAQDARQGIAADSVIETIKKRGRIVVGLSTFVPWAMTDKSGQLIGFEIDVAKQLAKDMGVEVEFVPTAWDGIIPALIAGKFDVIISGMSITPQRNLTVNFSEPYAYSGLRIAASTGIKDKVKTLEDFNSPEITFALRRGATPVPVVQKLFPKATLVQFDEDGASLQEVLNGNADATAEAFALRKGDPDALNFFNNWIDSQWRSGYLDERHDYWFRTLDWKDQVAAGQ